VFKRFNYVLIIDTKIGVKEGVFVGTYKDSE
jgi:hypothetical protein